MKNEEEWIKHIRRRMADCSESLPDGLWERLEQELERPKVMPLWRRWAVAAAVAILAVSSLTIGLLFVTSEKDLSRLPQVAVSDSSGQFGEEPAVLSSKGADDLLAETSLPEERKTMFAHKADSRAVRVASLSLLQPEILAKQEPEIEEVQSEEQAVKRAESEERFAERKTKRLHSADRSAQQNEWHYTKKQGGEGHKWELGLTSGNTFYGSANTLGGIARLDSRAIHVTDASAGTMTTANESAFRRVLLNNSGNDVSTEIHHKMPVTVGASLKWNLNEHWAFETGLNYTLLSSDLHAGGEAYIEEEQKLHYVGIPLKVHRNIWKNRAFRIYASAGGMVEKCVSAKQEVVYADGNFGYEVEHTSLDVPELQWSLLASVGGQVDIVRALGVYVEPGMAYYFDDNSDVETIRKEHPFQFNLQLGLRFMLGR